MLFKLVKWKTKYRLFLTACSQTLFGNTVLPWNSVSWISD